jgi:hypothetical protein
MNGASQKSLAHPSGIGALRSAATLLALNFLGDGLREAWDVCGDR